MPKTIPQIDRAALNEALSKGPRSSKGDPCFRTVEELGLFFTQEDIFALVNRALYQEEYQAAYHRKRAERLRELQKLERERRSDVKLTDVLENVGRAVASGKVKPLTTEQAERMLETFLQNEAELEDENAPSEETLDLLTQALVRSPQLQQQQQDEGETDVTI